MRAALEAGDDEAVKVAHEAIGRLLACPVAGPMGKPDAATLADPHDAREEHRGADVVDLGSARAKRGGRS